MPVFDVSTVDFEAVRAQATATTDAVNTWLASIDAAGFDAACQAGDAAFRFEDGFEATSPTRRALRASVVAKMVGIEAECKFDFGSIGSIWFDAKVPDPDTDGGERGLRVAFAPLGTRPSSWPCKGAKFVFVVLG